MLRTPRFMSGSVFMSRLVRAALWNVGVLLLVSTEVSSSPLEVVPGEYIVEFHDAGGQLGTLGSPPFAAATISGAARALGPRTKLISVEQSTATGAVSAARAPGTTDSFCSSLPKAQVKSCSPNYIVRTRKSSNDPRLVDLWGLGASSGADARSGWDIVTGSKDIVVAVLDSGVDYTHPDLAPNMWRNPGEIPGNGLDDDGNGYRDDVFGINAINSSGDPQDENGHGTHVAGTIGAVGDNGIGVVGVNWTTNILALRFLDAEGSGSLADAIEGMNYIIALRERGVPIRVINASWGGGGYSGPFVSTLKRLNELGVIFVAAAGNESNDNDAVPSYPSSYLEPNVVAVGAITEEQNLASFSNFGASSVDIVAPGDWILSTIPGGRYTHLSGTSMATPHVSGALALLAAHEPSLGVGASITRLLETGVPLPSVQGLTASGRALHIGRLIRGESSPLASPPLDEQMCVYEVAQSRYGRDTAADSAGVIQRGDELNFRRVELPFEFPFHRDRYSSVTVSPNGVLYMGDGPGESALDFEPGPVAPRRSIAAFHTDMVAVGAKSGVRVALSPEKATFRWVASLYGWLDGVAEVTLTLFPNGTIRDSIAFSSEFVEIIAQFGTTIGLSGSIPESAVTYATGGGKIKNGLELTFTPFCGGVAPARTTKLRLTSAKRASARSLRPGEKFWLDIKTDRPGSAVELGLLINGKACPRAPKRVGVPGGVTRLLGSTRAIERRRGVSTIGFFSENVVAQKRVVGSIGARRKGARKFSAGSVCRSISRSLRAVKSSE